MTPPCMSLESCLLLSSACVCISAFLLFIWNLVCCKVFPGWGALLWQLLVFLFSTSVCVGVFFPWVSKGARGLGTVRSLALFGGANLNELSHVTSLWLFFLWLSALQLCAPLGLEKADAEKWSGCVTTVLPWRLGGWLEILAFMVTYTSTKWICFWRISTKFLWREARERSWLFDTLLHQESNSTVVI